ncbi:MAG: glycosyltransferase family 2 protein [Candidatus Omnitrophota bacterium]
MKVTVAICAKNSESYVRKCLESIKAQSVAPAKILLIDDHSNDNTTGIAQELKVPVVLNEGHKLYQARNTALKYCNTDILAFIDSDCIAHEHWVKNIMRVFKEQNVAGGTGAYISEQPHNLSSWIYYMWFIVETEKTGFTQGIVAGNSYFKTAALRSVGGWIPLPLTAAEDVYIAIKLVQSGYKLWFDKEVIVKHTYDRNITRVMKKMIMSGKDIVIMMKTANFLTDSLWWYTLCIPLVSLSGLVSLILLIKSRLIGILAITLVFGGTYLYLWHRFESMGKTLPRFIARWIIIWPYSIGILLGLIEDKHREQ